MRGPQVVVIRRHRAGGTAPGLKNYTYNITAVVTVSDDGEAPEC